MTRLQGRNVARNDSSAAFSSFQGKGDKRIFSPGLDEPLKPSDLVKQLFDPFADIWRAPRTVPWSQQLRSLERDGVVSRLIHAVVPPKVELWPVVNYWWCSPPKIGRKRMYRTLQETAAAEDNAGGDGGGVGLQKITACGHANSSMALFCRRGLPPPNQVGG